MTVTSHESILAVPPIPAADEIEDMLLGCILSDPTVLDRNGVNADLFHGGRQKYTFGLIRRLALDGVNPDMVAVLDAGRAHGLTADYLLKCIDASQATIPFSCVRSLREVARKRLLWDQARQLDDLVRSADPEGQAEALSIVIEKLTDGLTGRRDKLPRGIREAVVDYVRQVVEHGGVPGLQSGFASLDGLMGGLRAGELTVLAARPSVGKSAFAIQVARQVASASKRVLYASPEMSEGQIAERVVSSVTGLPTTKVRRGPFSPSELAAVQSAHTRLPETLHLWDSTGISSLDVASLAHNHAAQHGIDLLIVDHLGWLNDPILRGENNVQRLGRVCMQVKAIGRRLQIPVILVYQLNRSTEEHGVMQRPGLSDLRESGQIEEIADNVVLVHRETRESSEADVIVAKNRQGATGDIQLVFARETQVFLPRRGNG